MISLYVTEANRKLRSWISSRRLALLRPFTGNARRLIVAPTDLRTVDPYVAEEILAGRFPLAGRVLDVGGESPFRVELPSMIFEERLHAFGWLRHIRADKTSESCANVRLIVDDWIELHGRRVRGLAWDLEIVAQRVVAWLSHSPIVLHDADGGFHRRFLTSLDFQVAYLRSQVKHAPDGFVRLRIRIALAMASISMATRASAITRAAHALDRELERQILPDGGHISRNPQTAVELLFDLLPLRQTYINLGHDVPIKLIPAIDRIFPAIRFFRHQGGDLALFNGASSTLAHDLMSVLRYDETAGQPFKALPHSQYQRLAAGDTVIIVDGGKPLSPQLSRTAHAGCLSFELSSGRHRFIVNSGSPRFASARLQRIARETAAHSTVILADRASSRISGSPFLGPVFSDGVREVKIARSAGSDGSDRLVASHDGYVHPFGVIHEREIRMSADGKKVVGRDRILLPDGEPATGVVPQPAVARFHIHPIIALSQVDGGTIRMEAPDGDSWTFTTPVGELEITEDIFFADSSGVRPSQQIEFPFDGAEIRWFLTYHS